MANPATTAEIPADQAEMPVERAEPTSSALAGLGREALPASLRLPVLDRLLEKMPGLLARRLRESWGVLVAVTRGPLRRDRLSNIAEKLDKHGLVGAFGPVSATEHGFVAFDRAAVLMILESALGGRPRQPQGAALIRPLTTTEASLMRPAAGHVLDALAVGLRQAGEVTLPFLRWRNDLEALAARRAGDSAIVLPLGLDFGSGRGEVLIALPVALLDPLKPALETVYPGDAAARESRWRDRLRAEVARAPLELTAVLHETEVPLSRMRGLKVGDTLEFDAPADPLVGLLAGDVRIAEGRLGRSGPYVAIRLEGAAEVIKGSRA